MNAKLKIGILGASGYGGGELLRLLLAHPHVEVVLASTGGGEAKPLADVHPHLRGLTDLPLVSPPACESAWPDVDVVFLALPHGAAKDAVERLPAGAKVIDLSHDFRLKADAGPFVYGLSENNAGQLAEATHVANPGCFATAAILALSPLVAGGMIGRRVIIDGKTGSTGAGAKPSAATHHPSRANSLFAYKPYAHQHLGEIREALEALNPAWEGKIVFQAHATPLVRGIYATVYATLEPGVTEASVRDAFTRHYGKRKFVRLLDEPPNANWVRGSNFCDLAFAVSGDELTVFAALDNLGKGAAGQAVQNLNLMHGWPETLGLTGVGGVP